MALSPSLNRASVKWLLYIAAQEQHHRVRLFAEEFKEFVDRHGLRWKREESR